MRPDREGDWTARRKETRAAPLALARHGSASARRGARVALRRSRDSDTSEGQVPASARAGTYEALLGVLATGFRNMRQGRASMLLFKSSRPPILPTAARLAREPAPPRHAPPPPPPPPPLARAGVRKHCETRKRGDLTVSSGKGFGSEQEFEGSAGALPRASSC